MRMKHCRFIFFCLAGLFFIFSGCQKRASDYFKRGEKFLGKGEFDAAIISYSKILKEFPESKYAESSMFSLGEISYKYTKDPEKAIEYYTQLLYNYPDSVHFCVSRKNVADIYIEKYGEFEKAVDELQKLSVQCQDLDFQSYAQKRIGDCYYYSGNYQQAIVEYSVFENSFIDTVNGALAVKKLGDCYYITGDMLNSEKNYRKFLELSTDKELSLEVELSLARVLLNQMEFELALQIYRKLIAQHPDRLDIRNLYDETVRRKAEKDKAQKTEK